MKANLKLQRSSAQTIDGKGRVTRGVSDERSSRQSQATAWWWDFDGGKNIEIEVGIETYAASSEVFVEIDIKRATNIGEPGYALQEDRETLTLPSILELDLFIDALMAARKEVAKAQDSAGGTGGGTDREA